MGNIQDTVDSSFDSTNFDRYGCVWTYLYSISNSDCDRNCFLYSFKSVSQEQVKYIPDMPVYEHENTKEILHLRDSSESLF